MFALVMPFMGSPSFPGYLVLYPHSDACILLAIFLYCKRSCYDNAIVRFIKKGSRSCPEFVNYAIFLWLFSRISSHIFMHRRAPDGARRALFCKKHMGWIMLPESTETVEIPTKKRPEKGLLILAEDTGLEPAGLLHLTRFPGELLSHSVNPPHRFYIFAMRNFLGYKMSVPF